VKTLLFAALVVLVIAAPILVFAFAPAPDAGSRPVEFKTVSGYAESPDSGLKGDYSCLALTAKSEFDRIFNPVLTPRGLPDPVSKAAFDTRLFVAVVKRDDRLWEFKVEKVTANGETLTVAYRATPHQRGDSSRGETAKWVIVATAPGGKATAKLVRTTVKAEAPSKTTAKAATTEKADAKPKTAAREGTQKSTAIAAREPGIIVDSPLIVSVPSEKYLSVVFIENGKKVGSARVGN